MGWEGSQSLVIKRYDVFDPFICGRCNLLSSIKFVTIMVEYKVTISDGTWICIVVNEGRFISSIHLHRALSTATICPRRPITYRKPDFSPVQVAKWQGLLNERNEKLSAKFNAANNESDRICRRMKAK